MKKRIFLLILMLILMASPALTAERHAKNVILFLADAGGLPTLHAAGIVAGKPGGLFVQNLPHVGLSETSSASSWVTDSAAGMTAIVTGQKTHNGVISQSDAAVRGMKDGAALKTILEYAEEHGLSTGVVSNSSIASATPAACYAHVNDRRKIGEIFAQILEPRFGDGVDVVIGPGRQEILAAGNTLGLDLAGAFAKQGRPLYDSLEAIPAAARRAVVLLDGEMDLGQATRRAIEILSKNPKGYFLMVESDVHTDRPDRGLKRMIAFDEIIQSTAGSVPENGTLILFTADHSFGLRVQSGRKSDPLFPAGATYEAVAGSGVPAAKAEKMPIVVEGTHTGEHVIAAGRGPGAARIHGFLRNTDLFDIMLRAYGWAPGRVRKRPAVRRE